MAPREATGSFPDQFLLFDYDSVVAPAAALPPPPAFPQQQAPPHGHMDHPQSASVLSEANSDTDNNHNNHHHTSASTASTTRLEERASGALSPVDPLSIDPTSSFPETVQRSPTNNNNNNAAHTRGDSSWNGSIGSPPLPAQRGLFPSINSPQGPTPPPRVVSSTSHSDPSSSSPLSTGSSVFYGSSPAPSTDHPRSWNEVTPSVAGQRHADELVHEVTMTHHHHHPQQQQHAQSESSVGDEMEEDDQSFHHEAAHLVTEGAEDYPPPPPLDHQQISSILSAGSDDSSESMRMIYRNVAFDGEESLPSLIVDGSGDHHHPQQRHPSSSSFQSTTPASPRAIMLSFGPNTTVEDLKYFAERGCIVALLEALKTPRLVALGTRMLADYAKMAHRRVAVASNKKILEFVQRTMLQVSDSNWIGREYAVETIRSLTATEASDQYLMSTPGLLKALALVSIGGPFVTTSQSSNSSIEHIIVNNNTDANTNNNDNNNGGMVQCTVPLASEKAQLHACIAIMNLSCGKANKMEIAQIPAVLEAMRDVMLGSNEEACLKATTCIKNLSNADANDAALLGTPALVEALGHVAASTCSGSGGATVSTTNACLALMNLSISKANKHKVFRTPGVMEALMKVLERTRSPSPTNTEARVKACSALSNLAIGYDNKIPMFHFPGFVPAILSVISTDKGEARTKACSILWSFAAEIKNQVPVVERGDILPVLVRVAQEDVTTEARFKCVAALTLLAESLENAVPLLQAGALVPLMDILQQAGADPTQWKGQTASWCVGFLMNISQSDEAVPTLRQAGVVELLAPLLTLDHYQSLKAAMAVTFCCRFDKGDECYDLLRKTETVIPKIINLLHNTLAGRGGNGYKYGVFTLRSSVGCIAALACGPDFMKERIATALVFESLLCVVSDFCVDGGTSGAIVGGGREDVTSAKLAVQALQALTAHLIPSAGSSSLPFGSSMEERLLTAYEFYIQCPDVEETSRQLAADAKYRMEAARMAAASELCKSSFGSVEDHDVASMASNCCGALEYFPSLTVGGDDDGNGVDLLQGLYIPSLSNSSTSKGRNSGNSVASGGGDHLLKSSSQQQPQQQEQQGVVRTFLLADSASGLRFVVPTEPSGGRFFNDNRRWCYRRGRFCQIDETPDPTYVWTPVLQEQYEAAISGAGQEESQAENNSFHNGAMQRANHLVYGSQ
ncbi:hypothetical protein ACA910_019094 [Epithemia clementina (nom. ined.)]